MGSRQVGQGALFYEFSPEDLVPQDPLTKLHCNQFPRLRP